MTGPHPLLANPHAELFRRTTARSHRSSSYDRTGANTDYINIEAGETAILLDAEGPGCVTHFYCAMVLPDLPDYRNAILRCYWDGADTPSVEVPLGDFFGLAHARVREFTSAMVAVNPGFGSSHGLNAYFPMPFGDGARITLENRGTEALGGPLKAFWFHVEYETYAEPLPDDVLRFHAGYRQERPTQPATDPPNITLHGAPNLTGDDNYVALDTQGEGRMVGLVLQVDNVNGARWYGEGDDMVFIDGEAFPPSIHGTGTEEIFGGGACPATEYSSLYSGFHLIESPQFDGLVGMYRWYVPDPIHFSSALRWTVEHGHANNFGSNYSSVAYWYQTPGAQLPALPPAQDMQPPLGDGYQEARDLLFETAQHELGNRVPEEHDAGFFAACMAGAAFYRGDWAQTLIDVNKMREGRR
ncbi:MAG TPA: glycoside hydrolase family 172 protein [Baekduia sp.]|jgi:hypothetical protein